MWMFFSATGGFCFSLSAVPRDPIRPRRFDPDTPVEETVGEAMFLLCVGETHQPTDARLE